MFKPDRNAPTAGGYLKQAGIFAGTIVYPDEIKSSSRGESIVRLKIETDAGAATDDYINAEKMWWKLNYLLAAVDPDGTKIPVADGADLDFSKEGNFIAFLRHFDGKTLSFAHFEETYTKKDGTQGTSWRVRPLDPRKKPTEQLPKAILALIASPAPATQEEPDEIPF